MVLLKECSLENKELNKRSGADCLPIKVEVILNLNYLILVFRLFYDSTIFLMIQKQQVFRIFKMKDQLVRHNALHEVVQI